MVGEWATLIDPYDVSELALVMEELLGDLPIIDKATRRTIQGRYSWDEAARQTLVVIERAAI